jgi:hypothetical protein
MKCTGRAVVSYAMVSIHKRTFKVRAANDQTAAAGGQRACVSVPSADYDCESPVMPLVCMRRIAALPDASNAECLVRCDT